jgi:phosphoacetylglucosamine mutase
VQRLPEIIQFVVKSVLYSEGNVLLAKTGVKHVHHKAVECCDVGVYFEANGHGTVVFGPKYFEFLYQAEQSLRTTPHSGNTAASVAMRRLQLLPSLINQAVGDALSDMLLVDVILTLNHWTLHDWNEALYTDLPSVQSKVQVPDRKFREIGGVNIMVATFSNSSCLNVLNRKHDRHQ